MTKDEIKAIRERCEKATEGTWVYDFTDHVFLSKTDPTGMLVELMGLNSSPINPDIEFITKARTDLPKALDWIEKLENDITGWQEQIALIYQMGPWDKREPATIDDMVDSIAKLVHDEGVKGDND